MDQNSEITALSKADGTRPLVVKNRVIDKLLTTEGLTDFTVQQYTFLQLLRRNVPVEEAASKVNMALETALTFKDTQKAREFLADREAAAILAAEAKDEDRWWIRAEALQSGAIQMDKSGVEAFKESGKRIVPLRGESDGGTVKIELNIDPNAVKEALMRQNAIDGELAE